MRNSNISSSKDQPNQPSVRILIELIIVLCLTLAIPFLWKSLKTTFILLPLGYFFVERHLRHRNWIDVGFSIRNIPQEISRNWHLILLVSIILQFITIWFAKTMMPNYFEHIISRIPFDIGNPINFLPFLFVATLGEEITYRALFQEHLSWFIPTSLAIGIISIAFAVAHWASGNPVIVSIDILLIIFDSILYGVIFARSKNVFVAWLAHFFADLFALGFISFL